VPLSCNLGTLTSWNNLGHSRPVTGRLFTFTFQLLLKRRLWFTCNDIYNLCYCKWLSNISASIDRLGKRKIPRNLDAWNQCSLCTVRKLAGTFLIYLGCSDATKGVKVLTCLLTPWCKVLLEMLTGLQLLKKFPAFHGTRRFITALTSVRQLSLSGLFCLQSKHPACECLWRDFFNMEGLLAPRPTPKLEDHP